MKTTNRKERRERKETFARFVSFAVKKNKKNGKFFGLPHTYLSREIQETKLGFPTKSL
ncbi:hypothetical protein JNM05_09855 [bacterium]|nr:hypothetical protein [bacterium]